MMLNIRQQAGGGGRMQHAVSPITKSYMHKKALLKAPLPTCVDELEAVLHRYDMT